MGQEQKNVKKVVRDWGQDWQKREKSGAGLGPGWAKNMKKWCGTYARSRKNVKKVVRDFGQEQKKREKSGAGLGSGLAKT